MIPGLTSVLTKRRFWPLFIAQFTGAANDNIFKNAMAILIIYRLGEQSSLAPTVLVNLAAGLFILPFFLFSATGGIMADRYEKSRLVRLLAILELITVALGGWALLAHSIAGMMGALFLLGVLAAFFGPVKYAILPELLDVDELVVGNALVEAGTFLAILAGTIAGGVFILREDGAAIVAILLMGLTTLRLLASLLLPPGRPGSPHATIRANFLKDTCEVLALLRGRRVIALSALGVSWFWLVGATYLAQFPAFAKDVLRGDEQAVTLMLTLFSVGIGLGSALCSRLLKGEISARHVPAAALAMSLFAFDLWLAGTSVAASHAGSAIMPLAELLQRPQVWRVLADLLLLAVAGGVYIVPLYTLLQARSDPDMRARTIAANNILNAAFMVFSAAGSAALLAAGATINGLFLAVAVTTLVVAAASCTLLPDTVLKRCFALILRMLFRVEVRGLEHLAAAGPRAVVVANHVSFLDAPLVAVFLPSKPIFAVHTLVAKLWWVRPFLRLVNAYPMDPANPLAIKKLIRAVQEGDVCAIFPEGRITVTGALMKIYAGPGVIADKADAPIVPLRIDGAQFSRASRMKGKLRLRWLPKITLTLLPPQRLAVPDELKGRARRKAIGLALYDIMSRMMFETSLHSRTLFEALLDAARIHGADAQAVEDATRVPVTYGRLVLGALILGRRITQGTKPGEALGLLLPNANASAVSFFGAQAYGRVPAMLNFTAGPRNVLAACDAAQISTVITSRTFIEKARLEPLAAALEGKVRVVYLEDVREQLCLADKLRGLAARLFAERLSSSFGRRPDDPAVILFTSGSEGPPKGVVLSHANIMANCQQLASRVAFSPADLIFNAMPIFHSFGLTGGLLLPVLSGIKTFLYPSPLHYRVVPETVYDINATIMFGTDTFLSGYARMASPYDFFQLRHIFAGAEKVRDETRRVWMETFGVRIMEGYGTTETSPVLALNTPMHYQAGTVGRLLPGVEHRMEPVPGIDEGGRLWVKGPNVMLGYLRGQRPGVLEPPEDGWHDTGDIVHIDELGYLRILDRAKRFAKVAGEMVSLTNVENELSSLWPGRRHAVVALPDEQKGQQLLLATNQPGAARAAILAHFRAQGLAELMVPRAVLVLDNIPVLGTGKTDYVALQALAEEHMRAKAAAGAAR
ncbi:MAG: acyl-[ACP]--phospholipid O-acyltransferase [Humidesulfovibrio sp.]|uniref:acyl-[ACP]--phospholipid O-acyltransferase n=1 Tax=Humidesulfovibrio sp. TaxID=2910988 RepID=UPI0027363833|nr:acyl-[ACP]--phospholipid O-acyltransferase [Humidesulfovibrio sp.]MDP2848442.1 acyl-[ACP]--phospholipid O-acyltransferase [Humidesulfovibrio sp.]